MNGFHIVRLSILEPDARRFLVKNPAGFEQEVGVDIDTEAVAMVERLTRRRLPFDKLLLDHVCRTYPGDILVE